MWGFDDCCSRCKTNDAVVYDHVAKKISCSDCGLDFGLSISDAFFTSRNPSSISKNNASSSDDDNLKNLGFDHLAVATTQQSNASSDDATIIASMSDRLNLLATVKKRYSTNLQMDSQAVKAAEEAVERCTDHVNRVFKMWGFDDCCSRYQTSDGFVYNHVAKNPSSSSDDNLQKLGFDLDVSTTQQSNASSDDATVIASMSDRLSLRATVKYIESLNELVCVFLICRIRLLRSQNK
ncbi:unnamed protein product [Brassica napus]|uniref:(rape) hypothetical protein n=1 Tax=Brassica napus TaxID=3708 RepID=A0A816JC11_BRANA|nr:unnamed protein product [Brassica napus]